MSATGLLVSLLLAAIPPLTAEQRTRLETAFDGRDHREEAFVALLEHVRDWPVSPGDAPLRLHPDFEAMLAAPDDYRGELCRITGVLQQQSRLARPFDEATEWFVRDESGRPILVYVVGLAPDRADRFRDGRRVSLFARFYKRIDAIDRQGRARSYPAFVGAHPRLLAGRGPGAPSLMSVFGLALLLLMAVVVFALLFVLARRQRKRPLGRRARIDEPDRLGVDEPAPLPDDPAEALAEMKRRAEVEDR